MVIFLLRHINFFEFYQVIIDSVKKIFAILTEIEATPIIRQRRIRGVLLYLCPDMNPDMLSVLVYYQMSACAIQAQEKYSV